MIVKYGISGLTATELAELGQEAGLAGSITFGLGFGSWGIEPTAFLEIALSNDVTLERCDAFVIDVLHKTLQEAAYRVVNGRSAQLLYANGRKEVLSV